MVIYPGEITVGRGQHRGEACVLLTVVDATGRAAPLVVLIEPSRFGLALTGEGEQPCAVQAAHYPAPPSVGVACENMVTNIGRKTVVETGFEVAAEFAAMSDEMDELQRKKEVVEGEIKALKERMAPVERQLLDSFAEAGVNNLTIHGKLLYIHRQIWARPLEGNYERACEVLKEIGLEGFVKETVNINTISAYVREQDELVGELPQRFTEAFKVDETYQVRARKK